MLWWYVEGYRRFHAWDQGTRVDAEVTGRGFSTHHALAEEGIVGQPKAHEGRFAPCKDYAIANAAVRLRSDRDAWKRQELSEGRDNQRVCIEVHTSPATQGVQPHHVRLVLRPCNRVPYDGRWSRNGQNLCHLSDLSAPFSSRNSIPVHNHPLPRFDLNRRSHRKKKKN